MTDVLRVELTHLFSHEHTVLELPRRGVMLVTGDNGSGKSSLVEAVAVAGWGKTLRGTQPWASIKKGKARAAIATDTIPLIERTKTPKGSPKLSWTDGAKVHGSTTKSQAELAKHLGPFDVWRRAQVFSSHDAGHFSGATDKERKAFLEAILGLEVFDTAVERCRADLKKAKATHRAAEQRLSHREVELRETRKRLEQAQAALDTLEPPTMPEDAPAGDVAALAADLAECKVDIKALRERMRALNQEVVEADMRAREAKRARDRLAADNCPTCEQPIPAELRASLEAQVRTAVGLAEATAKTNTAQEGQAQLELAELEEELVSISEDHRQADTYQQLAGMHGRAVKQHQRALEKLQADVDACGKAITSLEDHLAADTADEAAAAAEVAELKACERVLGLQGVRAQVLGKSLGGIETVANSWLVRLQRPDLQVQLLPYTENKTGGVRDAISLVVEGAGDGHGYQAASGGERRRLDVALLFALAEVSGAAHGQARGTLWFDEVFDALDAGGVEAVVGALEALAANRAVVVITHNPALVARLPKARRAHVVEGKVTVDE